MKQTEESHKAVEHMSEKMKTFWKEQQKKCSCDTGILCFIWGFLLGRDYLIFQSKVLDLYE